MNIHIFLAFGFLVSCLTVFIFLLVWWNKIIFPRFISKPLFLSILNGLIGGTIGWLIGTAAVKIAVW